jgi:hypothetical protein
MTESQTERPINGTHNHDNNDQPAPTATAPASLVGLGGQAGVTAGGVDLNGGVTECAGCKQDIDSTQGGTVVAFG